MYHIDSNTPYMWCIIIFLWIVTWIKQKLTISFLSNNIHNLSTKHFNGQYG